MLLKKQLRRNRMSLSNTDKKIAVLTLIAVVGLVALSFFVTTWLVMVFAGTVGHIANSEWLKDLSYWECSPAWLLIVILRFLFR